MKRPLLLLLFGLLVSLAHYTAWGQKSFDAKIERIKKSSISFTLQNTSKDTFKTDYFEYSANQIKINRYTCNNIGDTIEVCLAINYYKIQVRDGKSTDIFVEGERNPVTTLKINPNKKLSYKVLLLKEDYHKFKVMKLILPDRNDSYFNLL